MLSLPCLAPPIFWSSALKTLILENHVSSFEENCNGLISGWLSKQGIASRFVDVTVVYDPG